jgi:hypothetical protein
MESSVPWIDEGAGTLLISDCGLLIERQAFESAIRNPKSAISGS